jgi:hypothetical protein
MFSARRARFNRTIDASSCYITFEVTSAGGVRYTLCNGTQITRGLDVGTNTFYDCVNIGSGIENGPVPYLVPTYTYTYSSTCS